MRVEINEEDDGKKSSIALKLWVEDPKKLKGKYKDTGAIEFTFDLVSEVPEVVAQEMVNINNCCRVWLFFSLPLAVNFILIFKFLANCGLRLDPKTRLSPFSLEWFGCLRCPLTLAFVGTGQTAVCVPQAGFIQSAVDFGKRSFLIGWQV